MRKFLAVRVSVNMVEIMVENDLIIESGNLRK